MEYISIDIETTGLNPEACQVIEIGAISSKGPTFHCYVKHDIFQGEPYALSMHSEIFRRIAVKAPGYDYLKPREVSCAFYKWLKINNIEQPFTAAGKNFAGFDLRFLRRLPNWEKFIKIRYRVIDPGTLYWWPLIDGAFLPNTELCLTRAGLNPTVAHTALEDAQAVIDLIEYKIK